MRHAAHSIEDLSHSDIELLTQLLSMNHSISHKSWLIDQTHLISRFPASLLRPSLFLARLAIHLPFTAPCAILCPAHKPLNPQLIRRIFLQVTAEATTRVRRLNSRKERDLKPSVQEFLASIQGLNALWMSQKVYAAVYVAGSRFQRVESGCEACILAVIGGDVKALIDLRSSALGRQKKHRAQPRILSILEGWVDWSGEGDHIRHTSHELHKDVRHARKKIQRERRQKEEDQRDRKSEPMKHMSKWRTATPLLTTTEDTEDHDEHISENEEADYELSIISFYKDLMSSTDLAISEPEEVIHPAFRDSIMFLPESGTFQQRTSSLPLNRQTFYSQSAYSRDSGFGGSPQPPQRHSKSYRDLEGVAETDAFADTNGSVLYNKD